MFSTYLELFYSAVQQSVSLSFSNLILNFFNWRTKLTKLTPCQLAILDGLKKAQVIRVTQWRREYKRIWISGLKCWKILARSFMASLGLVSSLSLSLCHCLSQWLILCDFLHLQAPEGEAQPMTEVDLFISTQRIKVLNADSQVLHHLQYEQDFGFHTFFTKSEQMSTKY